MTALAHKLGPGSLKFGVTGSPKEFAAQCSKVELTPKVDSDDNIPVLSGEEIAGDESIEWTIGGTLYQSYDADSLIRWCFDNRLTTVPFTFLPSDESTDKWSGECRIVPVTIGGEVRKRNTSDFEFKLIGEPEPTTV